MNSRNVTVRAKGAKWCVRSANTTRAAKITNSQEEAISVGRRIAINRSGELVVYRQDGSIRSRDSFGKRALTMESVLGG